MANAVFNPGATVVDGETLLLLRVEDRRGLSHLHVARSRDGVGEWKVDPRPLLSPETGSTASAWGYEDARVVRCEELGSWVITCTAFGPGGPCVYLATTRDFETLDRRDVVMPPEDKNAAVFPRRLNGEWCLLHRPIAVRARTDEWLMSPDAPYERTGDVPNVVFPCGSVVDGDLLRIYYGAADTSVGLATGRISELLAVLWGPSAATRPGAG